MAEKTNIRPEMNLTPGVPVEETVLVGAGAVNLRLPKDSVPNGWIRVGAIFQNIYTGELSRDPRSGKIKL